MLGAGMVMTYKATGVINFGQAGLALWGAFAFDELRTTGHLVLPILVVPVHVYLGGPFPTWAAFLLACLVAILLGVCVQLLVFRPLRRAPVVAKIIASLGMLSLFQYLIPKGFGDTPRTGRPIFPDDPINLGNLS